jgi:undecaprenyl diphosphate synthase
MDRLPSERALPRHVAIIMDGNGRWASARGLPRVAGHRRGAEAVRETVRAAAEIGLEYLTLFSFSSENWKRPEAEVRDLMRLLRRYLLSEIAELHQQGIRLRILGERERLAPDILELINEAERRTAANRRMTLVIALSYGGRWEILQAARRLALEVAQGLRDPAGIDEASFAGALQSAGIPDPDLLIRTSGERRISNFLLWQLAYAELLFVERLWPDFRREDLLAAIADYRQRERRFGAVLSVP